MHPSLECQIGLICPVTDLFGRHGSKLVAMETNSLRPSPDWEPTLLSSLVPIDLLTGIQNHIFLVVMEANWVPWKPID